MNQRLTIEYQVVKNDRTYTFSFPMGSPCGEAYDAACEVLQQVVEEVKRSANTTAAQSVVETTNGV